LKLGVHDFLFALAIFKKLPNFQDVAGIKKTEMPLEKHLKQVAG
jgi:hypothetical protein